MTATPQAVSTRWLLFGLWLVISLVVFFRPLGAVMQFAAHNDDASHIFLIPFISAGIICLERRAIFRSIFYDLPAAAVLALVAGAITAATLRWHESWSSSQSLAAYVLAVVLFWFAGFALLFGRDAARAARFSLLLLLLAVPLPDFLLRQAVYFLQRGSAEMVTVLFDLTGVPYLREGFVFHLGRFSIEIAEECSGIRSSMAVLILALLAAHFYLHSFWKQAIFLLASLFIMIVKNGVRIAALTILALYVDPSFLFGSLHRDGGVVFFLLGLVLLLPILWLLGRRDSPRDRDASLPSSQGA